MARLNDNIRKYLRSYVEENSHSSAIMLTGPWGCGKTYFVKDFIDEFYKIEKKTGDTDAEIIKNRKLMYISLNGVSSKSEINRKLLVSHLCLENKIKYVGFASHLVQGYLEFNQIPGKVLESLSKSIEGISFEKLTENGKERIIFFDDLERCKMEPQEVLGYINDFIEHSGSGVVIVCDDSKLDEEYQIIKEKCVSREFEIVQGIDFAFDSFLEIEESSYNKFLKDVKNKLVNVFQQNKHENLRTLKNIMSDFIKFCNGIKEIYKDGVEKIPEKKRKILVNNYILLSFGLFSGIINKEDINKDILFDEAAVSIAASKLGKDGEKTDDREAYLRMLYWDLDGIETNDKFLSYNLWEDWFKKGSFLKDNIESFMTSSSFVFEEEKSDPSWYKLLNWRKMEDEEFDVVYKDVLKDLEDGEYVFAPHILHAAGILFEISKKGLTKESVSELKERIIEYINKNDEKLESLSPVVFLSENSAWGGVSYVSRNTDEFKEVKGLLYEKLVAVVNEDAKKWVPNLFETIEKNPKELYKKLIIDEDERGYKKIPIFKKDDADRVLRTIVVSKNKGSVFTALSERVRMFEEKPEFEEERAFYKELLNGVNLYVEKNKGKVSAIVLDEICRKDIEKFINIENSNDV